MRAVLSLGSNMANSRQLLRKVAEDFADEVEAASHIYRTPPWRVTDQPDFFNAILIVRVDCTPEELLRRGHKLEDEAQRVRVRHWGPRTLDVDIVDCYEDDGTPIVVNTEDLIVPHQYAAQRAFVLVPWQEVDPEAKLNGVPITTHLAALDAKEIEDIKDIGALV